MTAMPQLRAIARAASSSGPEAFNVAAVVS